MMILQIKTIGGQPGSHIRLTIFNAFTSGWQGSMSHRSGFNQLLFSFWLPEDAAKA